MVFKGKWKIINEIESKEAMEKIIYEYANTLESTKRAS